MGSCSFYTLPHDSCRYYDFMLVSHVSIRQLSNSHASMFRCEGVMYLMSPGRPAVIGLQLGKACYPCSR